MSSDYIHAYLPVIVFNCYDLFIVLSVAAVAVCAQLMACSGNVMKEMVNSVLKYSTKSNSI